MHLTTCRSKSWKLLYRMAGTLYWTKHTLVTTLLKLDGQHWLVLQIWLRRQFLLTNRYMFAVRTYWTQDMGVSFSLYWPTKYIRYIKSLIFGQIQIFQIRLSLSDSRAWMTQKSKGLHAVTQFKMSCNYLET